MLVGSFVENGSVRRAAELRWSEFSALKPFSFMFHNKIPLHVITRFSSSLLLQGGRTMQQA
jgi:hypothetical protein